MASEETCPYCPRRFVTEKEHSRATHIGICRAKAKRIAARTEVFEEEERATKQRRLTRAFTPQHEEEEADATDNPTTTLSFQPNPTDLALLQLYINRKDISASLLDDVLPAVLLPDPTHFSSAATFFAFVDGLPAPEFKLCDIPIPEVPEPFTFAYRSLLDVVKHLLRRHNGTFVDNRHQPPGFTPDFVHGARFAHLAEALRAAAGDDAVLMPVIFSSGLFLCVSSSASFCKSPAS